MEQRRRLALLDEDGKPVSETIQEALYTVAPSVQNEFAAIPSDVMDGLMGEVAVRMARVERAKGTIASPPGLAWTVLRNLARTVFRGPSIELHRRRAEVREGPELVSRLRAWDHSADQIEADIFLGQVLQKLTVRQRVVLLGKRNEDSREDIARDLGCSVEAVDVMYCRIKKKIRRLAGLPE